MALSIKNTPGGVAGGLAFIGISAIAVAGPWGLFVLPGLFVSWLLRSGGLAAMIIAHIGLLFVTIPSCDYAGAEWGLAWLFTMPWLTAFVVAR